MFDEVTKREGGKRAAKRGVWVAISSAVQALLVVGVIVVSTRIAAEVVQGPVVDVKFVKQAAPPPPPPPPAPRPKTPPKPRTDAPKPTRPPNPMAMVQPKEIPQELKPPDPNEAPEPEYEGDDAGAEGGVVGGVVGSTGAAPSSGGAGAVEDAPVYASAGFKAAREREPGCVGRAVRIPRDLAGIVSMVTVKFAVNRDGSVATFQVMGAQPDPRIGQAIWQAVQNCPFSPGSDPQGRPVNMWVILPLRFVSG